MQETDCKKEIIAYGARIKDDVILRNSTSGGLFTALSDAVIDGGGFVCGAIYSSEMEVKHVVTNSKKVRDKMRGAKYVQSNLGDVINEVIEYLNDGKQVLFVGTPCQVAALKNVASLKSTDDKLITVDIVCHGVPSPEVFKQHVSYIEEKYGKIQSYTFRDKQKGWRGQNVTIHTESGVVRDEDAKLYSSLYFNSVIIRPACHSCHFSSVERVGDITIGDFWGIAKENSSFNDNMGVSTVLVNSEKGKRLFEAINHRIVCFEVTTDSFIQPNMKAPTERSLIADIFWNSYFKRGIAVGKNFLKQYKYKMLLYRIKNKIRKMLK